MANSESLNQEHVLVDVGEDSVAANSVAPFAGSSRGQTFPLAARIIRR